MYAPSDVSFSLINRCVHQRISYRGTHVFWSWLLFGNSHRLTSRETGSDRFGHWQWVIAQGFSNRRHALSLSLRTVRWIEINKKKNKNKKKKIDTKSYVYKRKLLSFIVLHHVRIIIIRINKQRINSSDRVGLANSSQADRISIIFDRYTYINCCSPFALLSLSRYGSCRGSFARSSVSLYPPTLYSVHIIVVRAYI